MKNKKLTYILLPIVLFIWGIVAYRIIFANAQSDDDTISSPLLPTNTPSTDKEETYSLIANYADPFLKRQINSDAWMNMQSTDNEVQSRQKPKPVTQKVESKIIVWPTIQYYGIVSTPKGECLALMQINNKKNIVKAKSTVASVLVFAIFPDSVQVIFEKQQQTIRKNGK